jgi:hypothetical protein
LQNSYVMLLWTSAIGKAYKVCCQRLSERKLVCPCRYAAPGFVSLNKDAVSWILLNSPDHAAAVVQKHLSKDPPSHVDLVMIAPAHVVLRLVRQLQAAGIGIDAAARKQPSAYAFWPQVAGLLLLQLPSQGESLI